MWRFTHQTLVSRLRDIESTLQGLCSKKPKMIQEKDKLLYFGVLLQTQVDVREVTANYFVKMFWVNWSLDGKKLLPFVHSHVPGIDWIFPTFLEQGVAVLIFYLCTLPKARGASGMGNDQKRCFISKTEKDTYAICKPLTQTSVFPK